MKRVFFFDRCIYSSRVCTPPMVSAYFINDTTTSSNWGCRATTISLRNQISDKGINIKHTMYLEEMSNWDPLFPEWTNPYKSHLKQKAGLTEENYVDIVTKSTHMSRREAYKSLESIISHWDFVPASYADFESYAEDFMKNDRFKHIRERIDKTDIVIINGEGSIHDRKRKGRMMFFLIYIVKKYFSNDCIIINHTADVSDHKIKEMAAKVYPMADDVVFREELSAKQCSKFLSKDVDDLVASDAAFSFEPIMDQDLLNKIGTRDNYYGVWPDDASGFSPAEPYICIGGSSNYRRVSRKNYDPVPAMRELCKCLDEHFPHQIVLTGASSDYKIFRPIAEELGLPHINTRVPVQQICDILGNSSLYIGGRWHSSVLALTGYTPLITFTANTYKTDAILQQAGFDHSAIDCFDIEGKIDYIIDLSEDLISEFPNSELEHNVEMLKQKNEDNLRHIEKISS